MGEEMRQSESQFLRLAEETNILKDQVDYLRELSVSALKSDLPPAIADKHNVEESPVRSLISPTSDYRALESELRSQFSTIYQSLSNNLKALPTATITEPLDKDLLTSSIAPQDEAEKGEENEEFLLVEGRIKVTNVNQKKTMKKSDKKVCLTTVLTKLWILFFD